MTGTTVEKNVNYTPEMTATAVADYKAGVPVEAIAAKLGKNARSIVAKLSREGVYVPKAKTDKATHVKKAELIARIAELTGADELALDSLEKATSVALNIVVEALEGK